MHATIMSDEALAFECPNCRKLVLSKPSAATPADITHSHHKPSLQRREPTGADSGEFMTPSEHATTEAFPWWPVQSHDHEAERSQPASSQVTA